MTTPFTKFGDLTDADKERVVHAARPRMHVEPVVLGALGTTKTMLAVHLQMGAEHALLTEEDLRHFLETIQISWAKLRAERGGK